MEAESQYFFSCLFTLLILGGFSVYIITLIISQGMLLLQKIPVYGQICGRMLEKCAVTATGCWSLRMEAVLII